MKYFILVFCISAFLFTRKSFCQHPFYNNAKKCTVVIDFPRGGYGHGILLNDSDHIYLVTARHVLFDTVAFINNNSFIYELKDSICNISFFPSSTDKSHMTTIEVNCSSLFKKGLLRYCVDVDITILRICSLVPNNPFKYANAHDIKIYNFKYPIPSISSKFISSFNELNIGDKVNMFSPMVKSNGVNSPRYISPVNSLYSSSIINKVDSLSILITDIPSRPGYSGSPIFKSLYSDNPSSFKFIGVISSSNHNTDIFNYFKDEDMALLYSNNGTCNIMSLDSVFSLIRLMK